MPNRIDVKLVPEIVDPLLEILRAETKRLSILDNGAVSSRDICELDCLLNLFDGNYQENATITIVRSRCPTYVRACSYLRLQLRVSHLATIDDAVLEADSSPNPDDYTGELQRSVMCYCFLATIEEIILTRIGILPNMGVECMNLVRSLSSPIARLLRRAPPSDPVLSGKSTADESEVIVLNDPVNLMEYVTAVFQSVMSLSRQRATKHTKEIHELHRSVVWRGSKEQAERYVEELRSWHLTAECRRV